MWEEILLDVPHRQLVSKLWWFMDGMSLGQKQSLFHKHYLSTERIIL